MLRRQSSTGRAAGESFERALAAADAAWQEGTWGEIPGEERVAALERFAAALEPHAEEIAVLDAIDSGVPLTVMRLFAGSLADSVRTAIDTYAAAGDGQALDAAGRRVEVLRLPWGPAVLLTPWNALSGAAIGKLASALLAGCPTILKPSEFAPSFAQSFIAAAREAELPPGAFQILHGDAGVAGHLVADERVRAIALTGSQAAGRAVAAAAATRMAALQLELGGSNAAVVAANADLEASAKGLADGVAKLNGQWCEAPRRVFVARELHDELRDALIADLAARPIGRAEDERTAIGPLVHRAHFERVSAQASALGGEAAPTGELPDGEGFFFSPRVVTGAAPERAAEEIFGPVVSLHPVADDDKAVALANVNGDGLAGYVFSSDPERAFAIGCRLHAGEIRIGGSNQIDLAPGSTQSFWGTSGIGAHGGSQVLEAFRGSRIINGLTEKSPNSRRQPLVGITGPRLHAAEIRTTPSILLHAWVDSHYTFYPEAVARAGGLPVHLAREANSAAVVARLDALVVAGGHDVDPRVYGREPTATTTRLDPGRDAFELGLIEAALTTGIPVLGICRGAQLINIARGGTLVGELADIQKVEHTRTVYPPETRVHPVSCEPGSVPHRLYGETVHVNSFHHQSIDQLGRGVTVTALASDGTIEAIEVEATAGAVGVQWHPEMLTEPDPLFGWLVAAASVSAVEDGENLFGSGLDMRRHRLAGA